MSNPFFLNDNVFEDSTSLAASTTDPSDTSFNVLNVIDKRPYTLWQTSTAAETKYITVNTSNTTRACDAFGCVGHNLNGVTIAVQHSSDNFGTINTAATFTPTSSKAFMSTFSSAQNKDWRLAITQASSSKLKIGVALIGNKFALDQGEARQVNPDAHRTFSEGVDSKTLHPLGVTVRGRLRERTVNLSAVSATWVRDKFLPEWDSWMHKSEPALYAWNLAQASTATYYLQVDPNNSFASQYLDDTNYRNLTISMRGRYE